MAERFTLVEALNKSMDYFLYYTSRQHVKWKRFKCKVTFNNDRWLYLMNFSSILIGAKLVSNSQQNKLYTKS